MLEATKISKAMKIDILKDLEESMDTTWKKIRTPEKDIETPKNNKKKFLQLREKSLK